MKTPTAVERAREQIGAEYRKTATIRAVQWWKMGDHPAVLDVLNPVDNSRRFWIDTLEGGHVVTPGDWIATGVKGEHWPIKPDVFAATYEPATLTNEAAPAGEACDEDCGFGSAAKNGVCQVCAPQTTPDVGALVELTAFALRCSAGNPAAIGHARNESVEVLEKLGVEPRRQGEFFVSPKSDLDDARAALIAVGIRAALNPVTNEGEGK